MSKMRKTDMPVAVIELGIRIKEIISDKKYKQKNVAHDAGLDVENLRKYIKGSQEMKFSTMLKIASALKIEPSELIKGLKIDLENDI
jgi:DNA-binding Xre family transcriptional regulator